jgi:hypothetical protein
MVLWETLVETTSRHLNRYGALPPGLAEYLDPRMETLIQHLDKVARIAGGRPGGKAPQSPPTSPQDRDEGETDRGQAGN